MTFCASAATDCPRSLAVASPHLTLYTDRAPDRCVCRVIAGATSCPTLTTNTSAEGGVCFAPTVCADQTAPCPGQVLWWEQLELRSGDSRVNVSAVVGDRVTEVTLTGPVEFSVTPAGSVSLRCVWSEVGEVGEVGEGSSSEEDKREDGGDSGVLVVVLSALPVALVVMTTVAVLVCCCHGSHGRDGSAVQDKPPGAGPVEWADIDSILSLDLTADLSKHESKDSSYAEISDVKIVNETSKAGGWDLGSGSENLECEERGETARDNTGVSTHSNRGDVGGTEGSNAKVQHGATDVSDLYDNFAGSRTVSAAAVNQREDPVYAVICKKH